MEEQEKEKPEIKHPDRPIECTECRRPIVVHYTEIAGNKRTCTGMCSECPQLQKHLHGMSAESEISKEIIGSTGLACGDCGTTLEAIRMGTPLGCGTCYDIFSDVIVSDLPLAKSLPKQVVGVNRKGPLHLGRQPGEKQKISPSLKLIALNEALTETLKHEDYEQAAWLRDQIKELTGKPEKSNGKKK